VLGKEKSVTDKKKRGVGRGQEGTRRLKNKLPGCGEGAATLNSSDVTKKKRNWEREHRFALGNNFYEDKRDFERKSSRDKRKPGKGTKPHL